MNNNHLADTEALIIAKVMDHMKWTEDKAKLWYITPNPMLGECSAQDLVERGREHKVIQFIDTAIDESKLDGIKPGDK